MSDNPIIDKIKALQSSLTAATGKLDRIRALCDAPFIFPRLLRRIIDGEQP